MDENCNGLESLEPIFVNACSHLDYYPFGMQEPGRTFVSYNSAKDYRFGFNGKEEDDEVYGDNNSVDFGARIYDARLGKWLSTDPLTGKFPHLSPYVFVANSPLIFIDPDGNYFDGIFGQKVNVRETNEGKIKVGLFASRDLKKYTRSVNETGSETAKSQFLRTANNPTKVHFVIVREKVENGLLGLHQAYDKDHKPLEWDADGGKFKGTAEYVTDISGEIFYKEAKITLFQGNIEEEIPTIRIVYKDPKLTVKEESVSTVSHEFDHDLNQEAIEAIKTRQEGGKSDVDVEKSAYKIGNKVRKEIKEKRKK